LIKPYKMNYYHIQRINGIRKEWNKADIVETSDNEFFKEILKGIDRGSKPRFSKKQLIQHARETLSNHLTEAIDFNSKDYKELANTTTNILFKYKRLANNLYLSHLQYLKWIREEIFEHNRILINPELPSRKKCLWLCDKNGLENWWNTFQSSKNKKIIELELDKKGRFHKADAEFIKSDTYSISEFNQSSIKYWKGQINTKPNLEILYEGKFKVINEYNHLDDIITRT